jgi:MerR family transcriptional regulator, light-induced transcriptional regulator
MMSEKGIPNVKGLFDAVSPESAAEYEKARHLLVDRVNSEMDARDDLEDLIGEGNRRLMYDNHKNHAAFMAGIFALQEYDLLDSTMPWVYRTYHAHGFSFDYYPVELNAWIKAVYECLGRAAAEEISGVYRWMMSRHETCVASALRPVPAVDKGDEMQRDMQASFFDALMAGDSGKCLAIARKNFAGDRGKFFTQIIQAAMYRVGELWEKGKISVAQEHLASAVVSRVMTSLFVEDDEWVRKSRGTAVVTAACNEYHEIGARMVADLLEREGWNVYYLGANTPVQDVADLIKKQDADICAVSVAMSFNLTEVRNLIKYIRARDEFHRLCIMVGGFAFRADPDLWGRLGADGYAVDAVGAVELAERWRKDACGVN